MKIKNKAFVEALNVFALNINQFKTYFDDQRITYSEKKILKCWIYLRDKNFPAIFETLEQIPPQDELVEGNRFLLKAFAFNNGSEYQKAIKSSVKALEILKSYQLDYFSFQAHQVIFAAWLNLKNPSEMEKALKNMSSYKNHSDHTLHRFYLSEFNYWALLDQKDKAEEALELIHEHLDNFDSGLRAAFSIAEFCFYFKLDDYQKCYRILDEMKEVRTFQPKANYNFCKTLLEFIDQDKPLYINQTQFVGHTFLYAQLKVIKHLIYSELDQAHQSWMELKSMAPDQFGEAFVFKGDKCLFSVALDKAKPEERPQVLEIPQEKGKFKRAQTIISQLTHPITPDELFSLIWGKKMDTHQDKLAFKKMLYRLKQKGYELSFKKGCYYPVKKVS